MARFPKNVEKRTPFLTLPYEIRHLIYSTLYTTGQEIHIDEKKVKHTTNRRGPGRPLWFDSDYENNLPLACRTINKEITTMFYGKNAFSVRPETSVYKYPPIRCELFLSQLRPATASKVKKLHIFLGPGIDESFVAALVPGVAWFPHVEIRMTPLKRFSERCAQKLRVLMERACCLIAGARAGRETIWDVWGEEGNLKMLDSIMPNGYQRKK